VYVVGGAAVYGFSPTAAGRVSEDGDCYKEGWEGGKRRGRGRRRRRKSR